MRTRRFIFGLLLFLSCSAARAEYAAVNGVVYEVYDDGDAWVLNIYDTSGSVTIPSYITYRGVKYKVTGMCREDFDASAMDTYNFTSTYSNNDDMIRAATMQAAAQEKRERAFKCDYAYTRSTIKTLNLPNTLETIRQGSFDGMRSLQSLIIPASVTYFQGTYDFSAYKSIFNTYLPNLKNITILGLPYITEGNDTITYTIQDKIGNFIYVDKIKKRFDLSYCRNLQSFSMPEFEKKASILKAIYRTNRDLERETSDINLRLSAISKDCHLEIPVPAVKDEACTNVQTIQEAYNQAHQYLENMFKNCKDYAILYDSLMRQLKQHPYYDGTKLRAKIPVLDPKAPQTATITSLNKLNKAELIADYNDYANGHMEQNLKINQPDKYIAGYIAVHPEKKEAIEKLYLDYRCEEKKVQYRYIIIYLESGHIAQTCRQSQWSSYGNLYKSQEEFNQSYNKAHSDYFFQSEIKARQAANENLEKLKQYIASYGKKVKLSNMNKNPNDQTSYVIKRLGELKRSYYYYSDAVSYLIETFPKVQKEYEKNGQYFQSQVEFFDAYTSDSYSSVLKDKKK